MFIPTTTLACGIPVFEGFWAGPAESTTVVVRVAALTSARLTTAGLVPPSRVEGVSVVVLPDGFGLERLNAAPDDQAQQIFLACCSSPGVGSTDGGRPTVRR